MTKREQKRTLIPVSLASFGFLDSFFDSTKRFLYSFFAAAAAAPASISLFSLSLSLTAS